MHFDLIIWDIYGFGSPCYLSFRPSTLFQKSSGARRSTRIILHQSTPPQTRRGRATETPMLPPSLRATAFPHRRLTPRHRACLQAGHRGASHVHGEREAALCASLRRPLLLPVFPLQKPERPGGDRGHAAALHHRWSVTPV